MRSNLRHFVRQGRVTVRRQIDVFDVLKTGLVLFALAYGLWWIVLG